MSSVSPWPPVQQVSLPVRERRKVVWPTVIGVISIAMSVLSVFSMLLQVSVAITVTGLNVALVVGGLIGVFQTVLLLAGGVMLIQRKPAAATLHKIWACICLVEIVVIAVALVMVFGDLTGKLWERAKAMVILSTIWLALGSAYPVFLLIWMSRRFIHRDLKPRW